MLSLRTVRVCVAAFLLAAGARCTPKEVPFESPEPVPIRVLRVTNAYLPEFTDRELEIFLAEAQRFALDQLHVRIRWIDLGEMSTDQFFREYFPVVFPEYRTEDPFVLNIIEPNPAHARKLALALAEGHQRDSLAELMAFASEILPPEQLEVVDSKGRLFDLVAKHHLEQLAVLAALEAPQAKGVPLLDNALPYHQYVYWDAAVREVRRYDLIITNQLLASAETIDAQIHASLRGGITTGFTERSNATYGGSIVLSSYPVLGEEPPLVEMRGGSYTRDEAARYLGAYTSHELGHLLLHLDHPFDQPDCIMNPARLLRYREWYQDIERAPRKPGCAIPTDRPIREVFFGNRPLLGRIGNSILHAWDRLSGN